MIPTVILFLVATFNGRRFLAPHEPQAFEVIFPIASLNLLVVT